MFESWQLSTSYTCCENSVSSVAVKKTSNKKLRCLRGAPSASARTSVRERSHVRFSRVTSNPCFDFFPFSVALKEKRLKLPTADEYS